MKPTTEIVFIIVAIMAACWSPKVNAQNLRNLQNVPGHLPPHCKAITGDPETKDRFCEANYARKSRCDCQEICQVWGDPHVEPFFSGCSVVTMEQGYYTLFNVPGQVDVRAWVENKYVRRLYIGYQNKETELVYDAYEQCQNSLSGFETELDLKSDDGRDVYLAIATHCEDHAKNPDIVDWHLNTTVVLKDDCHSSGDGDEDGDNEDDEIDASSSCFQFTSRTTCKRKNGCLWDKDTETCSRGIYGKVPSSANAFSNAFGACRNPCNQNSMAIDGSPTFTIDERGDWECRDRNPKLMFWERNFGEGKCKQRDNSWDGRKFACGAQCSVFGDPYVIHFFQDMPNTRGCEVGKNCFNIYPDEDDKSRELYAVAGKFQALIETDECEFVTKLTTRYIINENGDYYEAVYDALEECADHPFDGMVTSNNRKIINAPGPVPERVVTTGLSANQIDHLAIDSKIYNPDVNGFHLGESISMDGQAIDAGGVRIIMKCHRRKDKPQHPSTPYFNLCVHRDEVGPIDKQQSEAINLKGIEAGIQSRGHCALGQYKKGNYENRESTQVNAASIPSTGAQKLPAPKFKVKSKNLSEKS